MSSGIPRWTGLSRARRPRWGRGVRRQDDMRQGNGRRRKEKKKKGRIVLLLGEGGINMGSSSGCFLRSELPPIWTRHSTPHVRGVGSCVRTTVSWKHSLAIKHEATQTGRSFGLPVTAAAIGALPGSGHIGGPWFTSNARHLKDVHRYLACQDQSRLWRMPSIVIIVNLDAQCAGRPRLTRPKAGGSVGRLPCSEDLQS
jgi:hypothetical protein